MKQEEKQAKDDETNVEAKEDVKEETEEDCDGLERALSREVADTLAQEDAAASLALIESSGTPRENGDRDIKVRSSSSSKTHVDTEIKTQTGASAETTQAQVETRPQGKDVPANTQEAPAEETQRDEVPAGNKTREVEVEVEEGKPSTAQTQVDETMAETQLTQPKKAPATTKETPAEDVNVEDNKPSTAQTQVEETIQETPEKEVDLQTAPATSAAGSPERKDETTPTVLPNGKELTMDNIVEYYRSQAERGVQTWKGDLEFFVAALEEHEQQRLFKEAKSHALLATHVAETSESDDWGGCPEQVCEDMIEFIAWLVLHREKQHVDKDVGNTSDSDKFSTEHRLFQMHMKVLGKDFEKAGVNQIKASRDWTSWSTRQNKYTESLVNYCNGIQENHKDLFDTFKEFMIIDCDLDFEEWCFGDAKLSDLEIDLQDWHRFLRANDHHSVLKIELPKFVTIAREHPLFCDFIKTSKIDQSEFREEHITQFETWIQNLGVEGLVDNGNEDDEERMERHQESNDNSYAYPLPHDDTAPDINNLLESAVEVS